MTAKPNTESDKSIDDYLVEFYEKSVDAYHAFMGTYTDAESDETAPDRLIEESRQILYSLLMDVIGDNETYQGIAGYDLLVRYQNDLKTEQRLRANKLFGKDK
jgi:hypothetical protein